MLHSLRGGRADGPAVVFLHGFGGSHTIWDPAFSRLDDNLCKIACDLPGHGQSLNARPIGSAAVAARAVLDDLEASGFGEVHLVGHSMGGAVAALCGLMQPERCASLTLLAPGGFGPEINHRLLRRFAEASEPEELRLLYEQFFGWEAEIPDSFVSEVIAFRAVEGASNGLREIFATLIEGTVQKQLDLNAIADLDVPIKVIWGTQDRVLPTRQAHKLPGLIAVHIFEGVGHMLPLEIPDEVALLVEENIRAGSR